jgi:6-pyruvoyltetrahydropterin/6-carboxytetrahydropterin synthase
MMYLTRKVEFCAAHRLASNRLNAAENDREFGKCARMAPHGHNYVLEVTLRGELHPVTGLVFNLAELKNILAEKILAWLDHRNLNTLPEFAEAVTSSEIVAQQIWRRLAAVSFAPAQLHEIRLWETENNSVTFRGEGAQA